MAGAFQFEHRVAFLPANAEHTLRAIPAAAGVFAVRGQDESAEPYLTRAADLRRRLRRLLGPPEVSSEDGQPVLSKRLNLRDRVRWIEWTETGSEFESLLVMYCASRMAFGAEAARRRLRLHAPFFLRVTLSHGLPRVFATNRLSKRIPGEFIGPYPSRAAAERHCDAVLDLFKLRRCWEELVPYPDHPGCIYGEMQKCLKPCRQECSHERYAAEAAGVYDFLRTRGASMLGRLAEERAAASDAMDFERAAALHAQWEKAHAAAQLADELVRPLPLLRALVVQRAAPGTRGETEESRPGVPDLDAALFLLARGQWTGPQRLSTLGVRAVREQTAVGSSLFAQPLMLTAVVLAEPPGRDAGASGGGEAMLPVAAPAVRDPDGERGFAIATLSPEERARAVLERLEAEAHRQAQAHGGVEPDVAETADALSLLRRWYYRPAKQRGGECFLPDAEADDGDVATAWPVRRLLNAAARAVLGAPAEVSAVDRGASQEKNTRVLHAGREGVERTVPVLPRRKRSGKAASSSDESG